MSKTNDIFYHMGGVPALAGIPFGPESKVFFLDPANGNDGNHGETPKEAFATLEAAYAALTANRHDTLIYLAGSSGLNLSAAFEWAKSYTHFIGMAAPTMIGQRARIFQLSTLTGASPLITISGSGCIWANLYIFQGVNDATSLINVSVTGGRNHFENVHFAGGGHATMAIDGAASLKLDGAEECKFVGCTIGVDTIAAATGVAGLLVDGDAKRCVFEDCLFLLYAGNAGAKFVEIADNAGFDRFLWFKGCAFINDNVVNSLTEAFTIPAGMGSVTHRILLQDSIILGADDIESADRGIVYCDAGTKTGGTNAGLALVAAS